MLRIIVAVCFACVFGGQAFSAERVYVKDACVWESFEASCPSDQDVLLIRKAFYGRMHSGRCFNLESNETPCYADVQSFVERHCGGRRSCKIKLTNENLKLFPTNCSLYSQKSLEIKYSCQAVHTAGDQSCVANQSLLVTTMSGYLANIVTDATGQGSQMCPWRFEPRSGQTVHLTLLDFGVWIDRADRDRRDMCRIYATIREIIDTTHRRSERVALVCGGVEREKFIMSPDNEMSIAMMKQESTVNDTTYFLIKYQVFDCPNYEGPALANTERSGSGIRITCQFNSDLFWDIKCVAGNWTPKPIINCPEMATTAPPCPEVIPPEGTTVNYTDNLYTAMAHCSNGPSVELVCINGVWIPSQTSVCFGSPLTGTQATAGSSSSSDQLKMIIIAGSAAFVALVVVVAIGATVACRKRQTERKKKMNGSIRSHSNNSYYTGQLLPERPTNRVQSEIYETLDESRMQDVIESPPLPITPSCNQGAERNVKTLQPNQKLESWTDDPSMLRRCGTLPVHRPLPEPNEYTTPLSRDSTYLMPREPVYLNPVVCDDAAKGQVF